MDEITLFEVLQPPPPPDAARICEAARARLTAATSAPLAHPARRRRGTMAAVAAAAALVAAGTGYGLTAARGSGPSPLPSTASRHQATQVQLAAFSVVTGPDGATTLTLYPGQVINPDAVRQALAEHGIPALVTAGKACYGDPAVAAEARQVYVGPGVVPHRTRVPPTGPSWPSETIVIHGSAIPSGDELSIGYRQGTQNGAHTREISFTVIQAGAPLTCTSIPG